MRRIYAVVCGLLIGLGPASARAQFVPVTSKIRFTVETSKGGQLTRQVEEGMFYRTENGSTLKHWTNGDAKLMRAGSGELFDNQTLYTYHIFYDTKTMIESPIKLPAPHTPDEFRDMESLGKDVVEGVPCDLVGIEFAGPGPEIKPHRVGSACISRDYGLWLRRETRDTKQDGRLVHTLFEMYDIRPNVPPDSNEFEVLHSFSVVKKTGKPLPPLPD